MEAPNGVTAEQFKINHLRQRIAAITVQYEDLLVTQAVQIQLLTQDRDALQSVVQDLQSQLVEREAELDEHRQSQQEREFASAETLPEDPDNAN